MSRKPKQSLPLQPFRCCGKNSYRTRHEAERVADEQMLVFRTLQLETYRCQCGCGGWHLTRKQDSGLAE